ncbi:MAG TPA: translation initiation factor IF-2 [Candidatus Thermoplasmatota archaeon]|jgi:translation initiation factor 5B|nr:translation initiation factor IF-2 [Candidatus Thermoplasmatota archaeon]
MPIRQPIVSVLGHVDHGKTSLLDRIRGTSVVLREAGRITQHIGATEVPLEAVEKLCGPLLGGKKFKVPGLLFIDTPGHHAFSSLRARGGALADIAVVVVDLNEGVMPQTREAMNILRKNKTPFVIAANKIDRVLGWQAQEDAPFQVTWKAQVEAVQERFDTKFYELIGTLSQMGYPADRYDRVGDFTKSIAIIPISATHGEGLPDLLMILVGLAQRFLEDSLQTDVAGSAKGTVLEVKEERGLGATIDAIVYDGTLHQTDTIVLGGRQGPLVTHIKALLRPKPMDEIRDPRDTFDSVKDVHAAAGVKISAPGLELALAGSPLYAATPATLEEVKAQVAAELQASIELADAGLYVKADTLGSLEAIASELRDKGLPIKTAEVGDVSRRDVVNARTAAEVLHRAILAFNVKVLPDAKAEVKPNEPEVFEGEVIYHILDRYQEWAAKRKADLEAASRGEIVYPGKLLILPDHVFRVSKPAVVGVRVLAGRIRTDQRLVREDGREVGAIKSIRTGEKTLSEAKQGEEVAVAIEDVTVGRQIETNMVLFIDMPEGDARALRDLELTYDEREALEQLAQVKRREKPFWGM